MSDLQAAVPDGFNEAVAAWQAHCECLSSDDHRKSPYWLPITECWSERRMQHAATLANRLLELTDPTPVDEAWLRSLGFSLPKAKPPFSWFSMLIPPANSSAAITELRITNDGKFELQLVQGYPDDPHARDDFVSLTSVRSPTTRGAVNSLLHAIKGE